MNNSGNAVFLSYASEDAEAAKRICDALRVAGIEVWFDQSELRGGDAWDQKIRKQIKECALFVPVISANTQARAEGYFRLEWRLADQRTHLMRKGNAFLLPVAVDETRDTEAHVPDSFLEVQWTRIGSADSLPAFSERVEKLLTDDGGSGTRQRFAATEERRETVARSAAPRSRRWVLPALMGAGLIAAAVGFKIFRRPSVPPVTAAAPAAALSGTEQLIAKIYALVDKDADATRDEWLFAENLGAQVVAAQPTNAAAWTAYAEAALGLYSFYFDRERRPLEDAVKRAQQAVGLAPQSDEAQFVLARCYGERPQTRGEGETLLRALLSRRPNDGRVLRAMANCLRPTRGPVTGNPARSAVDGPAVDEALMLFDRAIARPGGDPAAWREKASLLIALARYDEAEAALERCLALRRGPAAEVLKISLRLFVRGDLEGACDLVEKLPGSYLLHEDVCEVAVVAWLWKREPQRCLAVLDNWREPFLWSIPTRFYVGQAYALMDRPDAAKLAWRNALTAVDQQIAAKGGPSVERGDRALVYTKARLHALLGETAEAEEARRVWEQALTNPAGRPLARAALLVALGHREEALQALSVGPTPGGTGNMFLSVGEMTPSFSHYTSVPSGPALRFDQVWDPLRNEPRFQARLSQIEPGNEQRPPANSAKSVAVLAFRGLSADPENEFLSDAISDELCSVLGRVPGLKVAATASSFSFKGKRVPLAEIGAQLGVAYLVDGTVQKVGNRVRVRAQLIKAADGFVVWNSDTLEHEVKDMFAVQDEVVASVAKNLQVQLGAAKSAAVTVNPEAYRLYYEGREAWSRRAIWTADDAERTQGLYQRAIALQPSLGRAYAGLVDISIYLMAPRADFGHRNSTETVEALGLADKAIELEPDSAEAHTARGRVLFFMWRSAESERELRTAVRLNPNYADAHINLARTLHMAGRMDEAIAAAERATELGPLTSRYFDNAALILADAGHYAEMLAKAERALALEPESTAALRLRILALSGLGRHTEAVELARHPLPGWPYPAYIFARAGLKDEALRTLEEVRPASGRAQERTPVSRAVTLAALGQAEAALDELKLDETSILSGGYLLYRPEFDPVRRDPKFVRFLADVGWTEAHERAQAWRASFAKTTEAKAANQRTEGRGPASAPAELRRGEQKADKNGLPSAGSAKEGTTK